LLLFPQNSIADARDERIRDFLKKGDVEAWEIHLWNNASKGVMFQDIMQVYKKQYNLDIAIRYSEFPGNNRKVLVDLPIKRIISRDKNIPRGLALQLYLDNYKTDVTYAVDNGTIWIVPGKGTLVDESKNSELSRMLKTTKPKYDNGLNKEGSNRVQVPPSDLLSALNFFANDDRGNFRLFVRDRDLPLSTLQARVKVPDYADLSYDAILNKMLSQVNARYIVNSNSVVIVPAK
jgi:hypothetical protein